MPHSCQLNKWECPICNKENSKHISFSTITNCDDCKSSLSWNGVKVVTYEEWLNKR
jgi:ribosomal protein L37AE/L43A